MTMKMGKRCKYNVAHDLEISPHLEVVLGDNVMIGTGVKLTGTGRIVIGDYVKIHRLTWINCTQELLVGHNVWIGEKSIVDATARLVIGDNVGVGAGSQIWTHMSFGDVFSGCRLRSASETHLGDEAWLCGPVLVQAVNIASRVVVMGGSNVVRPIEKSNTVWAGNPATEVTDSFGGPPWAEVTVEQKMKAFDRLRRLYERETKLKTDRFVAVANDSCWGSDPRVSYFNVDDRTYTKRSTDEEARFMQWLLTQNKAKFVPSKNA